MKPIQMIAAINIARNKRALVQFDARISDNEDKLKMSYLAVRSENVIIKKWKIAKGKLIDALMWKRKPESE